MRGLLLLCFDYSRVAVDEFNAWYDTEHIPERERTKGILNAMRWLDRDNRRISVATYDLESVEALRNPEYLAISGKNLSPWSKRVIPKCMQILRFEGRQFLPGDTLASSGSEILLLVGVNAAGPQAASAKEKYREHASRAAKVPGVMSARFFEATNELVRFLELYELASAEVLKSQAWTDADAAHALGGLSARAGLKLVCDRYRRA